MSIDLERSLDDLARSVGDNDLAERMNGQVYRMVAQVRRRRAARYTTNGVVGMGAAAAVVIGGMQLAGRDDGTAPVATGAPAPDEAADGLTLDCGDGVADDTLRPTNGGLRFAALELPTPEVVEGDALDVSLEITNEGTTHTWDAEQIVQLAALRDGVIVATGTVPIDVGDLAGFGTWRTEQEVNLSACGGDTPLGAGDYELVAAVLFADSDGSDAVGLSLGPVQFTIDANPLDAEAAGLAAVADIASGAAERGDPFAVCGSVVPLPADALVAIDLALEDRTYAAGDALTAQVGVRATRTIPAGAQLSANNPQVVLTYQGVVVGRANTDSGAVPIDLAADGTGTIAAPASFTLCSLPGADAPEVALPAGTYQAYAALTLTVHATEVDGTQATPWEPVVIRSEPVDVTLG